LITALFVLAYSAFTVLVVMASPEKKRKLGIAHTLARPNILALQPYRCARDDYSEGILLDANENALGPTMPKKVGDENHNPLTLERYPSPYQIPLKEAYAAYRGHGLRPENIFVGVGSDEAIDLLMRIFCAPTTDAIMTTPPTYGMYKVCAAINDVQVITVPLTPSFDLRIPEMLAAVTPNTKLMFVCTPGNPTAKAIPLKDIEALASSPEYKGLVVVDEAYVDFSPLGSAAGLIEKYPNVVVLQTLSKAFGLAGIRLGFALGSDDVIQLMNNVKAPYNVNSLTSNVALNALNSIPVLDANVKELMEQREVVREKLNELDFVTKVFPSDSNFLLFQMTDKAKSSYTLMANRGVVTRFRGNEMHCKECIRVTIGSKEENVKFLEELPKAYKDS